MNDQSQMRMPKSFSHLDTDRSIWLYIILNTITGGIYGIVIMTVLGLDINTIASRHDGKKTMHYCLLVFLVAPFTLGIGALVWMHRLANRIADELARRGVALPFPFGAKTFWLWSVLWPAALSVPLAIVSVVFALRIESAAEPYGLILGFAAAVFVLALVMSVGMYVYIHKLFKAMNTLAADYNTNG